MSTRNYRVHPAPLILTDVTTQLPRSSQSKDHSKRSCCHCSFPFPSLTKSMTQSFFWETNIPSDGYEIYTLWEPKFHHRLHNARNWTLFWARYIHFTSFHPTSLRQILIFLSNPLLRLPSVLFFSIFPTNILPLPPIPPHVPSTRSPSFDPLKDHEFPHGEIFSTVTLLPAS